MTSEQLRIHKRVRERDNNRCQDCGVYSEIVHHIISRRYNGTWSKENMLVLCQDCHRKAHSHEARKRHLSYLRDRYGYSYTKRLWLAALEER